MKPRHHDGRGWKGKVRRFYGGNGTRCYICGKDVRLGRADEHEECQKQIDGEMRRRTGKGGR